MFHVNIKNQVNFAGQGMASVTIQENIYDITSLKMVKNNQRKIYIFKMCYLFILREYYSELVNLSLMENHDIMMLYDMIS